MTWRKLSTTRASSAGVDGDDRVAGADQAGEVVEIGHGRQRAGQGRYCVRNRPVLSKAAPALNERCGRMRPRAVRGTIARLSYAWRSP
jgi:hypothetical protein